MGFAGRDQEDAPRGRWGSPVVAQVVLAAVALAATGLWPPVQGPVLLLPLVAGSAATINAALVQDARLLGPGPFPGSVIVEARGPGLIEAMLRRGTLAVAAAPVLCGAVPLPKA